MVVTKDKLRSEMQEYGVPKYERNENRAFLVNPGQGIGLRPLHLEGTAKKKDDGTVKVNSTRSRFQANYEPVTESEYLDSVTSNEN